MPTIAEQLTQLASDRDDLVSNLTTKGITGLTGDETFTELVPEVLNIPSGGGTQDIYRATTLQGLPNNANEGDLGVVYYNTSRNPGEDDTFYTVSFPQEVVLENEIESYIDGRLTDNNYESNLDIMGDSSFIDVNIMDGENNYRVAYTSNDGLTFTLDNPEITSYTFSNEMHWDSYNEDAAKFLLIGGAGFDGLYSYDNGWNLAETQFTATNGDIMSGKTGYTNSGVTTGTLGGAASSNCNDAAATIYVGTKIAYDNMSTVTTRPPDDIVILPVRFDGTPIYDARTVGAQYYCSSKKKLRVVEGLDITGQVRTDNMFTDCTSLVYVGTFNTASCTWMAGTFTGCTSLETVCLLNTQNNQSFNSMFSGCASLKNVPQFDTSGVSNVYGFNHMFSGCPNLTNDSLNNILGMCANATQYNGVKTLITVFGSAAMSQYYPASTIQGLSNYQAFTAAGWTIGW